jgi:Haem degrading protein HbpS-like
MHVNLENAEKAIEAARKQRHRAQNAAVLCRGRFRRQSQSLSAHGRRLGGLHRHFHQEGKDGLLLRHGHRPARSQPGKPLYGIEHSNDGLITFPGGLPIVDENGVLVGAIGVSGSSVENDHKAAEAGVKVLGVSELPEHAWRT